MSGQLIGRGYMTIVGLRDGDPASTYVLLPSVESVTKKLDGTLSVGEVCCSVYKVTGSAAYALSADHTLRYVRKPDGATDILEHANGVSGSITVLSDTESIEFELSDSSNVIDRVRIPILSDATDVNDELDLYRYLREAIANGDTQFKGGLMLSSLIRLGEWANADTDNPTMAKVWSGMNGLYKNGRTIANWWGGDMVDLFDENDNLIIPAPANAAAGLVRMDGSYYYSNGNIGGRADGSIWVGGQDGLKIDKNGHITLGSGIHIGTGDGTDPTTLASILNFINNLTKLIVPVNEQKEELSWAHPDVADCYALKAKKGLFSMGFLSAHGLNADGGNSGGAGGGAAYDRLDAWADYSTDREGWVLSALLGHDLHTRLTAIEGDYVKLSELPSLTGYATEQWVLAKGYITQDALTPYLTEADADGKFVTALGVSGKFLTWTRNGVTNNLTVPFATDADTLDGYHESSFLRARGLTRTDQEETPWDQIGIKGYYDALPAGLSSDVYPYGQVITLCETSARFEIYASHNSSAGNGLYFRTGWNNGKRPWQMLLDTGNYSTILDGRYSHTLTLQLNGTEIGTFNPTANKTINIGDVASAAALASHTSNTTVHITATERALWNKAASDLSTILGSDSDTVINKWEEVVAFLDTYTEADTLAGLLSNKVDKVAGYGLSKNDFNDTLLAKLNSIEAGANRYVLPTASATVKGGIKVGSGLMMASEVLSVNLNASHIPALDWSKITTGKPTTLAGYGITDAYTKAESDGLFAPAVAYNYADGCLVRLKTPANAATMTTVLIEGQGYWKGAPIKTTVKFYNYPPNNAIIAHSGTHFGYDFGTIKVFNYDGQIYLWFIQDSAHYTFAVTAITAAYGGSIGNAVESITNAPMPTEGVTRLVTITPSKGLRTDNYASLLDSRYQLSANIHALTFTAGAFSAKTYDPKSAALTVNIPNTTDHIAEGGNLYFTNARAVSALSSTTNALQAAINTKLSEATFNAFKTAFDGMFELVNIGTDAAPLFAIHAKYGLYSDSFLSAHGLNDAGGNGGSSYSRLDDWNAYDNSKEGYVLSAKLGYDLYQNKADSVALSALASRVGTLEGKNYLDALTLNLNGSGNAVTAIGLSADKKTLSVTKGATFLTQHQSLANYYTKGETDSKYLTALGTAGGSLTYTKGGVTNNLTVPFATDADTLDGLHENSFLRWRGFAAADQEDTLWAQLGIKEYSGMLPDGLTDAYNYGEVVSLASYYTRFDIYVNEMASKDGGSGIYYRSGWVKNKRPWRKILDSQNYAAELDARYMQTSTAESKYLKLTGGVMANSNLVNNLNSDLLDGHHKDAFNGAARYGTRELCQGGYYKIKIKDGGQWMLSFKIIAYQNYALQEIVVTGYHYDQWHRPSAALINAQGPLSTNSVNVTFGYDADGRVWVAIPAAHYAGITVTDVANGFQQVTDVHNLFKITYENTLSGTVKTTLTASRHATLTDNVASATKLADNATYTAWGRPFFAGGKPQNVSGALRGVTELYTSGPLWFEKTDESKGAYFSPAAGGSIGLYFHENYGYKLCTAYFAYNGNIGFGTVNPAYKVDIVGTAKISEGLLIGGLLSANGGISTTAITATEIHLGPITLKYSATDKGLQVIGGGLYTDSYLSAHGPSPTTVDYEARIAALESKIAQLENQLSA